MKIADLLRNVTVIGLDTAPLIYFIERRAPFYAIMRGIIQMLNTGRLEAVTSTITLTEVLSHPMKLGRQHLVQQYNELLSYGKGLRVLPVTRSIAYQAADLRARYNLRTPDALQLAACITGKAALFITNDHALSRVTEIQVVRLDEIEL